MCVFYSTRLHMVQELEEEMKNLMNAEAQVAQMSILSSWEARFELTQVSFFHGKHLIHCLLSNSICVTAFAVHFRNRFELKNLFLV